MNKSVLCILLAFVLTGCASDDMARVLDGLAQNGAVSGGALTQGEIAAGLREALRVGSETVVRQLGKTDGFNADPQIHIPLPDSVRKAKNIADNLGMSRYFDDLELKLNRAAEAATPRTKALFISAIQQMTLTDARNILRGPDDAATRFFQQKMTPELSRQMQPIVSNTLSEVGALRAYEKSVQSLGPLAQMLPDYRSELTHHVVKLGMDGIFHYIAQEEAAIRHDPVKRTTEILRRVFQ